MPQIVHTTQGTNLADLLERVLDKGIVIAGDIRIKLVEVELLTISLRLVVASVERAREMGIDWWTRSSFLNPDRAAELDAAHQRELEREVASLKQRLRQLEGGA